MTKKILPVILLIIADTIVQVGFAAGGESVEPVALKCEYRVDPQGIDITVPRLNWILKSDERGQKQTAYQILVASSKEKLDADVGNLWNSKKVSSDRSIHIAYKGLPLQARMCCYWKVRIWDKDEVVSSWSLSARWSMGLLRHSEWRAEWISFDTNPMNKHKNLHLPPCPYLRKKFSIHNKIQRATMYVSALGLFELYINGSRVGKDYFTPGWTNYMKRVYYMTYDVTDLLNNGENVIGAILANGWYAGYVGFAPRHKKNAKLRAFYGEIPALIAQLEIEYKDGKVEIITSDKTWKAFTGPILEADIQMGETYDARLEMPGWNKPLFSDREWTSVVLRDSIDVKLNAFPADPVQKIEKVRPVEFTEPKKGVYIFNMGQNFAGRVRLKVKGKRGTCIVLRFAEMLHDDGTIMTENLRNARCTDTYYLKGDEVEEIWEPRFTYHGFQYVEVTGFPGKVDLNTITGVVLHSALSLTASFKCSNELVNKLYENIVWTQRSNFFDIPTDCPQRDERLAWTGDAQVYIRSATYIMDVAAFFTKWLAALEDDQRPSGAFPDFAPLPFLQFEPSPGWMDAGVICPYTIYKVYGDTRIINKHYHAMKKFMDFLTRTSNGYLRFPQDNCWGDWLAFDSKTKTPKELITTAYYAYDAKLMAEMAAAIGEMEDARKYTRLFENIKAAFNRAYVFENGHIMGDTQTGYALALYMKLLPETLAGKAGARLVELIKGRNWHIATGFLGIKHLLPALTEQGYSDVSYRLLTNKTYPSWGYSIENGATTIWERWNSYTKSEGFENPAMNSFSHYAFGSVCEWMFSSMAGIDTDGPGFKRIIIRPRPWGSNITFTKATYNSIHGLISSGWQIRNGKFILNVTIPANTTATVYVPTQDTNRITESSKPVNDADGVDFIEIDGNNAVFSVESGKYQFESMSLLMDR